MDNGVSEVLHVASMGIDWTFKLVGTSADLLLRIIKSLCEKAALNEQERRALDIAMSNEGSACLPIKIEDKDDFVRLAKQHGVDVQTADIITSKTPVPELTSVIFPARQMSIVHGICDALGYARPGEVQSQSKNGSPSAIVSEPLQEGELADIVFRFASDLAAERQMPEESEKDMPETVVAQKEVKPEQTLEPERTNVYAAAKQAVKKSEMVAEKIEPHALEEMPNMVDLLIAHAEGQIASEATRRKAERMVAGMNARHQAENIGVEIPLISDLDLEIPDMPQ